MKAGTQAEASIVIGAPPDAIYNLVADVTNMGRWSPECQRCEWIDGATGPEVGARFKGTNRRRLARWSTKPRVVVADPGREFAFVTGHRGHDMTAWRYQFASGVGTAADTTTVTESFEMLRDMPWYFRLADRVLMRVTDRRADLEANLIATLASLRTTIDEDLDLTTRAP